jgi:ATP-dependent Clp protease ATP-binding subunit ClpA
VSYRLLIKTIRDLKRQDISDIVEIRGSQSVTDQNPEDKYQALKRFGKDITDIARKGKLDPVIGRDDEIRRVIQVLSRRTKNNPVLIGEPGCRKDCYCGRARAKDCLWRCARRAKKQDSVCT